MKNNRIEQFFFGRPTLKGKCKRGVSDFIQHKVQSLISAPMALRVFCIELKSYFTKECLSEKEKGNANYCKQFRNPF